MPEKSGRRSLLDLSSEEIVHACEENYINYWRLVGMTPNAEFSEEGGVTRCVTGISQDVFNVVLKCNLDERNVEKRVDETIAYFKSRRIPLLWHTGLTTEPRDIGRYLEARGFPHDYDLAAMAIDLEEVDDERDPTEEIVVRQVADEKDCTHWTNSLASSWESPPGASDWMMQNACFNMRLEQERGMNLPRRMYLGYLGGRPAGVCMLVWDNRIAGIEMVGTVDIARRKGVGMFVITRALRDARSMGFKFVVVLATIEGVRLYEKCGFKKFGVLPEHSMDFRTRYKTSRFSEPTICSV